MHLSPRLSPSLPLRSALTALALAALSLAAARPAAAQSLNGQPVNVTERFPDAGSVIINAGTRTIAPTGTVFATAPGAMIVTPGQIIFTFVSGATFAQATFNGFQIAETGGSPTTITGVSLDPLNNLAGFDASRVTFDATDVFANFQGLSYIPSTRVTLDLQFAPTPAVPEPSSVASLGVGGLGLLGLLLRAAKRRKTSEKPSAS